MFLKNNITDYSKLDANVQDRKNAGSYPATEFTVGNKVTVGDLKEYNVEATNFNTSGSSDMPFPKAEESNPWDFGK